MKDVVIHIENVSKLYRLGVINRDMLYKDVQSWWARFRGKKDPNAKIEHHHHRLEHEDEFWALRDVNLEVRKGEVLGIIGRNGAGKSTLLKILSQITAPTEGRIKMKGKIASLLEVGTGFHPELTGRENVFLNGAILGMSRAEVRKKFDEITDFAEISEFIDTPVKRYSSGMYVRLAFAVAAHLDPDVLIVDEVLAVGDAAFQKKCIGKMGKVAKEGRTVILVTHSMALAETLTERCAWMHDGEVRSVGASKDIVQEYLQHSKSITIGVTEGLNNHKLRRGPGQVRVCGFQSCDAQGNPQSQFIRGQPIILHFQIKAFQPCRELAVYIAFKLGLAGEYIGETIRQMISATPLVAEQEINCCLEIETSYMPSAIYDLYIWLGPQSSEVLNEYYDILDGLVPPIEIMEDSNATKKFTTITSKVKNVDTQYAKLSCSPKIAP
ncbi:MAG: polysaccharide ABC transporter ATP-binding protein [Chthoniobacterales bacterium]